MTDTRHLERARAWWDGEARRHLHGCALDGMPCAVCKLTGESLAAEFAAVEAEARQEQHKATALHCSRGLLIAAAANKHTASEVIQRLAAAYCRDVAATQPPEDK